MAENIASRVSRMISGTANMLVDAMENMAPEMVMEEAIREIDTHPSKSKRRHPCW